MSDEVMEASSVATTTQTITAADKGPSKHFRDGVREHVIPINNLYLITASLVTLVGSLDFLSPYTLSINKALYAITGFITFTLVCSAIWPGSVDRILHAMGYQTTKTDSIPLWKRPIWQVVLALFLIVSAIGYASVAKASEGGLLASHSKTLRSWQEELLQLRQDIAGVKAGVDAANSKLDTLVDNSKDPQKDLIARGYTFNDSGLMQALKQADAHAVGLFVQAHYVANYEGPMAIILNGDQPWNGDVVALLPKSMFFAPQTCREGSLLNYPLKPPAEERIAAFKRLCDPAPWVAMLKQNIADDQLTPAPNDRWKQMRAARKSNLAVLMQ